MGTTRGIIRASAMSCACLRSATRQSANARWRGANGVGDSCKTTRAKPPAFFDPTG